MSSSLTPLVVGLALGGSATWAALAARHPAHETTNSAARVPASSWSWRDSAMPPRFDDDSSASAVAAWFALRADDGAPARYAARATSLRALLVRLPDASIPSLVATLGRSGTDDDLRLRRIAFNTWARRDPAAAARWALDLGDEAIDLAREAIDAWVALDADAAATWACAIPDERVALKMARPALRVLAGQNRDRALALARSRAGAFRRDAMFLIMDVLGPKDPAGTIRAFAPELWSNGAGFNALKTTIAAWAKQDAPAAIGWLLAQPRGSDEAQLTHWIDALGNGDSAWSRTVAGAIAGAPGLPNRAAALQDLMFRWGINHPEDVVAWLNSLPDADLRITLLERASRRYQGNSPEKSLPFALAMPEGSKRTEALSNFLGLWASRQPDAVLAWLRAHQAEPGVATASHSVHRTILAELAREDPQAAIVELKTLSDPATRHATIQAIVQQWGKSDPASAMRWVADQTQTDPTAALAGFDQTVFRWAKRDPEAALRWVEDYAARHDADHISHTTIQYLEALGGIGNETLPRAATADLYSKITDSALRQRALTRHVREWLTKDPDAARAWVAASPALTAEQRAAILAPAD